MIGQHLFRDKNWPAIQHLKSITGTTVWGVTGQCAMKRQSRTDRPTGLIASACSALWPLPLGSAYHIQVQRLPWFTSPTSHLDLRFLVNIWTCRVYSTGLSLPRLWDPLFHLWDSEAWSRASTEMYLEVLWRAGVSRLEVRGICLCYHAGFLQDQAFDLKAPECFSNFGTVWV